MPVNHRADKPKLLQIDAATVTRQDYYRLQRLQKSSKSHADHNKLPQALSDAKVLHQQRTQRLAALDLALTPELPVTAAAEQIRRGLQQHQVVIVAGETGSGKTTQLPKICMQMGLGVRGMIGHTQPRRLAARTVAKRIATETRSELGESVGFAVRFSEQVQATTLLKVMTDGLLLREISRDRFLNQYDAIIIDEAHERSLNIDFLLGFLRSLLGKRTDLKLIITSATIDVHRFAEFFHQAPVVEVGGRSFPVAVKYQGPSESLAAGLAAALEDIEAGPQGRARDVLVFLSGEQEIFNTARELRKQYHQRYEILPLYARLSFAEQQKIFQPGRGLRRIVLATNVAETSLTVPNIGYVIDPGQVRINRYSYRSKLQRLPIEAISQASAEQRKGRCGRVAPGVCYRLFDEEDFRSRPQFTDPEIHRVNLGSVVLQMLAFKLGRMQTFPFIDPPDPRAVRDAHTLLLELQALHERGLTKIGQQMARLPVDPRLARMLVEAQSQGAVRELLIITAALAVQDPRERPVQKAQMADQAHSFFAHERSDFLTYLTLWQWLEEQRQQLTRARFSRMLQKRFLSPQRVQEWREVHRQLRLVCRELGYRENTQPASYAAVHACVISGSLSLVAQHDERGHYLGARNLKLRIFPGSVLAQRTPRWMVAGEIAQTSRVYARNVAVIEPGWVESQAAHLLKHQYSEPFWSSSRGEAMAHKSSTLYGLRVVERRQISFTKIDPVLCRDLFLREGLVAGQVKHMPDFLASNLLAMAHVQELEAKGRRRDLLLDDDEIYSFYAQRIPQHICRVAELRRWLRKDPSRAGELVLAPQALLRSQSGLVSEQDFPGSLAIHGLTLPIGYRFAPGEVDDGITVTIPVGLLNGVHATWLEWSVPGLLPNLVEQWLRTLPKQMRRQLAPLADKVEALCGRLLQADVYRQGRLLTALADLLSAMYGVRVAAADWDPARVAGHLLPFIKVVDEADKVVASGRDLGLLKARLGDNAAQLVTSDHGEFAEQNLADFPARPLLPQVVLKGSGGPVVRYPGLRDDGEAVHLQLFADARSRDLAIPAAYGRLALQQLGKVGRYFRAQLDKHPQLGLHYATLGSASELQDELLISVVWYCFFEGRQLPLDRAAFAQRLQDRRPELATRFNTVTEQFADILALRFSCKRALEGLRSSAYADSVADIRTHLERLVPKQVLGVTPSAYLALVPRYLQGVQRRIESLPGHVPKDRKLMAQLQPLELRLQAIYQAELVVPEIYISLKFYIEELRLALFAQTLARQRVKPHPLDDHLQPGWKASLKRVQEALLKEEQRLGLS